MFTLKTNFWRKCHGNGPLDRPRHSSQLKGRPMGSELLISRSMLKSDEELRPTTIPLTGWLALEKVTVVDNDGATS